MQIMDGTGTSNKAGVCDEGHIQADSITKTSERHVNEFHGKAYQVVFSKSPTANDDCIFYMVNSDDENMVVEGVWLQCDGAGEVYFQLSDVGTRNSATALTPTNCNAGSGNVASGTFEHGVDLDGGSATLTGGSEVIRYVFGAANNSQFFNFEQDIIIPKNQTMTIWCDTAARTISGTVVFNYH